VYTEKTHEHESDRRWVDTDCMAVQNRRIHARSEIRVAGC
jgi:hypothetical protein